MIKADLIGRNSLSRENTVRFRTGGFQKFVPRVIRMSIKDFATTQFSYFIFDIPICSNKVEIITIYLAPHSYIYDQVGFNTVWSKFILPGWAQRTKPKRINV